MYPCNNIVLVKQWRCSSVHSLFLHVLIYLDRILSSTVDETKKRTFEANQTINIDKAFQVRLNPPHNHGIGLGRSVQYRKLRK